MTKIITATEIAANRSDWLDGWSDLFKGLHGVRPRWTPSNEELAQFYNTYDEEFELHQKEEQRQLDSLSEQHGIEFKTWSKYYDHLDTLEAVRWAREQAEYEAEVKANKVRLRRLRAAIAEENWEFGATG